MPPGRDIATSDTDGWAAPSSYSRLSVLLGCEQQSLLGCSEMQWPVNADGHGEGSFCEKTVWPSTLSQRSRVHLVHKHTAVLFNCDICGLLCWVAFGPHRLTFKCSHLWLVAPQKEKITWCTTVKVKTKSIYLFIIQNTKTYIEKYKNVL